MSDRDAFRAEQPITLANKAIGSLMWDNRRSEAARSCRSTRPLAHLIDLTDRQDEMNATTEVLPKECRLCHRVGERLFTAAGNGDWVCSRPRKCAKRRGERLNEEPNASAAERLVATLKPEGDCLVFDGHMDGHGYGQIHVNGRNMKAHRLAWIVQNGPIPTGLNVLHRCDNPPCCNPEHLFLGTHLDNMADREAKGRNKAGSWQLARTHCREGHPYSGDNLVISKTGVRLCRICRRASDAKVRQRRREAASDAPSGVPGHQGVSEAVRSPQEPGEGS